MTPTCGASPTPTWSAPSRVSLGQPTGSTRIFVNRRTASGGCDGSTRTRKDRDLLTTRLSPAARYRARRCQRRLRGAVVSPAWLETHPLFRAATGSRREVLAAVQARAG